MKERKRTPDTAPISVPLFLNEKKDPETIFDCHPAEIARQLTLMDQEMYLSQVSNEFFKRNWLKNNTLSPNLNKYLDFVNKKTFWCIHEILSRNEIQERAKLINIFLYIANCCLKMNNFNTAFWITRALKSNPISRLSKSWSLISYASKEIFLELDNLIKPNSTKYFPKLKRLQNIPAVPDLFNFLHYMENIDEASPDMLKGTRQINILKLEQTSDQVKMYFKFQIPVPYVYSIQKVDSISNLLDKYNGPTLSSSGEKDLLDLSTQKE